MLWCDCCFDLIDSFLSVYAFDTCEKTDRIMRDTTELLNLARAVQKLLKSLR